MGTIQSRPHGKFIARVRKKGFPAQSRTFLTRADARRWITETEAAMSRACFVDTSVALKMTLGEALSRYAAEVTPKKRGAAIEAIRLAAMGRDRIAAYSLANITPQVLAQWRDRRLLSVSGSTVNRDINLLRHVLRVAEVDWGAVMPLHPVELLRRPRSSPGRERRLSVAEQSLLLHACRSARVTWLAPFVELLVHTAMRRGELLAMRWEWIDLTKGVVTVPAAATKTERLRSVPLSPRPLAILRSMQRSSGPVFGDITANAVKLAWQRAVARAGLPDLHMHDLRHEATSRLFEVGLSSVEVASVTGHRTLAMLQRYTHLDAAKIAQKLAQLTAASEERHNDDATAEPG